MKKAYNQMQYGVFIDHSKAYVIGINEKNEVSSEIVKAPLRHLHFAGEKTAKTGQFGHTLDQQRKQQHKEHQEFGKFCKAITSKLTRANQIYVFGPATAKQVLRKEIEQTKALKGIYLKIATRDKMDKRGAVREVKGFYK